MVSIDIKHPSDIIFPSPDDGSLKPKRSTFTLNLFELPRFSISLFLSLSHTHTHTLSLSLSVSFSLCLSLLLSLTLSLYIYDLSNLSTRVGCNTRSMLKQSLIVIYFRILFLLDRLPYKVKLLSVPYYLPIVFGRIYTFPKNIRAMRYANSLVHDSNSVRLIHLWRKPLQHRRLFLFHSLSLSLYIYIYIYNPWYIYIYIYIYMTHTYIYIYIYITYEVKVYAEA